MRPYNLRSMDDGLQKSNFPENVLKASVHVYFFPVGRVQFSPDPQK